MAAPPPVTITLRFVLADSSGFAVPETAALKVCPPIVLVNTKLKDITIGVPYQDQLVADGGAGGPYTFEILDGLPAGLTCSPDGLITGTVLG